MRRVLKWAAISFGILFVVLFVAAIYHLVHHPSAPADSVLEIPFDGELAEAPPSSLGAALGGSAPVTLPQMTTLIRRAGSDPNIVGLVLKIESPEVGVAQVEDISRALAAFRKTGKWSIGYLETAGELSRGDGAYSIAAAADRVVLAPCGDVDLVGLSAQVPFFAGTLEKLDVQAYVQKRKAYKTAANSFNHEAMTPEGKQATTALVDDLQAALVHTIAASRHVSEAKAHSWILGGPYLATDAKAQGMVDSLGYWDTVLARVRKRTGRKGALLPISHYRDMAPGGQSTKTLALIVGAGEVHRGDAARGLLTRNTMSAHELAQAFRAARKAKVAGVLFRIDSPGGSYIASDLIRRQVELTHAAGIPVVVSMGDVAASGGYFAAMDADRIVAEPGTITGSIGVFAASFATRAFFKNWLGITFDGYDATPNASAFSWLDPPNAQRQAMVGHFLDRVYADFVTKAAHGRKKTVAQIEAVAQGRVWSGTAALHKGLVDELGGIDTAVTQLKKLAGIAPGVEPHIVAFPHPKSTFQLLRQFFSGGSGPQMALSTELGQIIHSATGRRGLTEIRRPLPLLR